jgi:hypothetical protein
MRGSHHHTETLFLVRLLTDQTAYCTPHLLVASCVACHPLQHSLLLGLRATHIPPNLPHHHLARCILPQHILWCVCIAATTIGDAAMFPVLVAATGTWASSTGPAPKPACYPAAMGCGNRQHVGTGTIPCLLTEHNPQQCKPADGTIRDAFHNSAGRWWHTTADNSG